jgi:hypothetical protein
MPVLLLSRECVIINDNFAASVHTEPCAGVSDGWLARISPDPTGPLGLWRRDYLVGVPDFLGDRAVIYYGNLPPGTYEAHSTLRSREAQVVCFEVSPGGGIELLGALGDEDWVLARLNGLTTARASGRPRRGRR